MYIKSESKIATKDWLATGKNVTQEYTSETHLYTVLANIVKLVGEQVRVQFLI